MWEYIFIFILILIILFLIWIIFIYKKKLNKCEYEKKKIYFDILKYFILIPKNKINK